MRQITKLEEYNELLKNELVVLDFTATWCGPCKRISPIFEKLASENDNIVCVKVDVDDAEEIVEVCEISCMPTFKFYRSGELIKTLTGSNEQELSSSFSELSNVNCVNK